MNNEIKEILDRLERIDHKEYSGGFEFADSGSFDEDCRCFEERKKLANYITNLQKTNKNHSKKLIELGDKITNLQQENKTLKDIVVKKDNQLKELILQKTDYTAVNILEMKVDDYKSRCEKAVEYIKKTTFFGLRSGKTFLSKYLNELLNILNGSDE